MIEECHDIIFLNCGVNRETIQWPEHIKTIFDSNINKLTEIQKVSFKNLLLQFQDSSSDIDRTEMILIPGALLLLFYGRKIPLFDFSKIKLENMSCIP